MSSFQLTISFGSLHSIAKHQSAMKLSLLKMHGDLAWEDMSYVSLHFRGFIFDYPTMGLIANWHRR